MVASPPAAWRRGKGGKVSIPFIAGQWSLRDRAVSATALVYRLNPLHCGAVVASGAKARPRRSRRWVSIPFIAGQWSLRLMDSFVKGSGVYVSIPFIAGQWSLRVSSHCFHRSCLSVSIPFIAGQWSLLLSNLFCFVGLGMSQSPSLRGSGRFWLIGVTFVISQCCLNPLHCGAVVASACNRCSLGGPPPVSIPFIAGQWSLPRGA